MAQDIAVQIQGLTKTIGRKTIVDNLSFEIPRGEVFGFLGPNGAGKTTTIRMMVGLISITRGQVLINGIDISKNFSRAMAHVGAIVENPELYKFLTGYQNLLHFARMDVGITRQRIGEVMKLVGLEGRIHDKVKTNSLGMRQRLGLAQALLRKPNVLILDEPTNGLDPAGIRELRDHLRDLASREGIAVVVSSHLLSEMELMCDRVAIIQAGKLIEVKTVRELVSGESNVQVTQVEVHDASAALDILRQQYPGVQITENAGTVELAVERSRVPDLLRSLVQGGIDVYAVRSLSKSLEDTFLEMTGGHSVD